ncbi:patched family-domain-containing protein [Baffinella frigidus]|nr:patched family-domain-containing protein [Cryptophyta sp. CCMP2293]
MFLLIAHPFTALLVVLNTAMVLADILGLMWLWDISLNSISIVNLVLAIGLAVDYSAHVAHAFMSAEGTRDERMVTALSEMGADVCHGAFSTFLAVLVLGASKSYIFRMFFKQFFGICFFGATHGLMLLPVVLSLVGPPTHKDHAHGGLTFEERTAASKDGSKHAPGAEEPKSSPHHVDVEMAAHYAEPKAVNTMSAVATTKNPNLEVGYGRPVGDA